MQFRQQTNMSFSLNIDFWFSLFLLSSFMHFGHSYLPDCQRIDAVLKWPENNKTYFFSASEYITYNDYFNAEEDVNSTADLAVNFPNNLDSAVNWFKQAKVLFFKGCFFYKIVRARGRQPQQQQQQQQPQQPYRLRRRRIGRLGLPCDVNAALKPNENTVLVFKGCQYWTVTRANPRRATLTGTTTSLGLPCDLDAAFTRPNGTSYVIKGDLVWSLTSSYTAQYRFSLEDWSLCSWTICGGASDGGPSNNGADGSRTDAADTSGEFPCNGDRRFCGLKLSEVTLAGSHNAGSGFDGGFGFLDCWVRNQGLSVLGQLNMGARFLDVDPSWGHCGLLGTFHNFLCGGPLCRMIKQIKRFLRENRHEVLGINFNHEMRDVHRVIPALVRQLTSQLGNYVNSAYRDNGTWPTLRDAIISDRRLFVIIDKRVAWVTPSLYLRHRWIHSERLLESTWHSDVTVSDSCGMVLDDTHRQCRAKANSGALLEVSILGTSINCVTSVADLCLPLVHDVSRACQGPRHEHGRVPNVLLVDFPERAPRAESSVAWAAHVQNVRNVARLARGSCALEVDSAVTWKTASDGEVTVLFYTRGRPVLYSWTAQVQLHDSSLAAHSPLPGAASAVFRRAEDSNDVCFLRACTMTCAAMTSSTRQQTYNGSLSAMGLPCEIDSAFMKNHTTFFFKGCLYWRRLASGHVTGPQPITDFGQLPCSLSATLQAPDGATYFFKGDNYWKQAGLTLSPPLNLLDWAADFLQC